MRLTKDANYKDLIQAIAEISKKSFTNKLLTIKKDRALTARLTYKTGKATNKLSQINKMHKLYCFKIAGGLQ